MEKEIRNSLYNGRDAVFVRYVSSKTLDYFDLPVAGGDWIDVYDDVCGIAHHLNHEHSIISGEFVTYDFWYKYHINNGNLFIHGDSIDGKNGLVVGGVLGSGFNGFWINPDTFEIHSLCDMLYITSRFAHDIDGDIELEIEELPNEKEVKEFVEKFNNKIREARK